MGCRSIAGSPMNLDPEHTPFVFTPRTVLGLAVALLGVTLTLDRLGLVDAEKLLRFWPIALMLIGALMFAQARDRRERSRGVLFGGIGTLLLLNSMHLVTVRIW